MNDVNPFDDPPATTTEAPPEVRPEGVRVHVTEIDRWLECGHRAGKYARGEWEEPPRPEALRGRAIHAAREYALKAYLKSQALPAVEECVERASAAVHEDVKQAEGAMDDVMLDSIEAVAAEARLYARADREAVLPDIAPHVIAVEEAIELPVAGEGLTGQYVLTGRPDAVARSPISGRLEVPDLKTSKYAPSSASVNTSTQHSLYSALVSARYGSGPVVHNIHHLRVMPRGPKSVAPNQKVVDMGEDGKAVATSIATERTADDVAAALRRLRFVLDAREQGYAPPAPASFLSACHRCPHRGAVERSQRCEYVPATRAGEEGSSDE